MNITGALTGALALIGYILNPAGSPLSSDQGGLQSIDVTYKTVVSDVSSPQNPITLQANPKRPSKWRKEREERENREKKLRDDENYIFDMTSPLHEAVEKNDIEQVRYMLVYVDANIEDGLGRSPIHHAAKNNNPEIIALLLENEANIDSTDRLGATPLHTAVERGSFEAVEALLEAGAGLDLQDKGGRTALFDSVIANRPDIAKMLLKRNAKTTLADGSGYTPRLLAEEFAREGRDMTKMLSVLAEYEA